MVLGRCQRKSGISPALRTGPALPVEAPEGNGKYGFKKRRETATNEIHNKPNRQVPQA
jgi:hypothetical protein